MYVTDEFGNDLNLVVEFQKLIEENVLETTSLILHLVRILAERGVIDADDVEELSGYTLGVKIVYERPVI